jgi:acyl carrier protein
LIWQELLGVEKISVYDNFFELGGHSLLAMRALSVMRKEMDVEISVKTFFQLGTIDAVAKYIRVNRTNLVAESADYKAIRL